MATVQHATIGKNEQEREHQVLEREEARREWVRRYNDLPFRKISLDQAFVWFVCATAATSAFLYCTVSAVRLAVN